MIFYILIHNGTSTTINVQNSFCGSKNIICNFSQLTPYTSSKKMSFVTIGYIYTLWISLKNIFVHAEDWTQNLSFTCGGKDCTLSYIHNSKIELL